jgi:hypothetical protein
MNTRSVLLAALLLNSLANSIRARAADADLRERIKDEHVLGADHWIYNDLDKAKAEARRLNKPLFVTFRCVPCKNCSGFDAEVAKGSELIKTLAQTHFVALRQVEMKGVDLSQFQFDHDLNWAAMFINADGTVYGRYGTQSAEGPDAFNSIASLEKAMMRVLALHDDYPRNKTELAPKRGKDKPWKTAFDMPGLDRKEKLRGQTERGNCIHCHNIHDAEQNQARAAGVPNSAFLERWPLPDNVGVHIDPQDGAKIERVEANTPAAKAGLHAGDLVTRVDGQPIVSIADIQWVLHSLPGGNASVKFTVMRAGKVSQHTLAMSPGWKKGDISWRGSMWSLRPRPGFWAREMKPEELTAARVPTGTEARKVQYLNGSQPQGKAAIDAGLRSGDVIVAVDDKPLTTSQKDFDVYVRLQHKQGDKLQLTLLRNGREEKIAVPLVE